MELARGFGALKQLREDPRFLNKIVICGTQDLDCIWLQWFIAYHTLHQLDVGSTKVKTYPLAASWSATDSSLVRMMLSNIWLAVMVHSSRPIAPCTQEDKHKSKLSYCCTRKAKYIACQ